MKTLQQLYPFTTPENAHNLAVQHINKQLEVVKAAPNKFELDCLIQQTRGYIQAFKDIGWINPETDKHMVDQVIRNYLLTQAKLQGDVTNLKEVQEDNQITGDHIHIELLLTELFRADMIIQTGFCLMAKQDLQAWKARNREMNLEGTSEDCMRFEERDALRHAVLDELHIKQCRQCGCTEHSACVDSCYWVEPDLCSACMESEGDAEW